MSNETINIGAKNAGNILDDPRLSLSNTTDAGAQQYRIWRDGQNILIPKGQSTTLPLQNENVAVNTSVHGAIKRGVFQAPIVEFRNTTDYALFDRFELAINRADIPDGNVDLDDLGLRILGVTLTLNIVYNGYFWALPLEIRLYKDLDGDYFSDCHHYATDNQVTRTNEYILDFFACFYVNKHAQNSHLLGLLRGNEIYIDITRASIINGASVYNFNFIYNPHAPSITIGFSDDIVLQGGWS